MTNSGLLVRARELAVSGEGRRVRLAAGVSLREIARDVSAHWSTIARWETGATRPHGDAAVRWVAVVEELSAASGVSAA